MQRRTFTFFSFLFSVILLAGPVAGQQLKPSPQYLYQKAAALTQPKHAGPAATQGLRTSSLRLADIQETFTQPRQEVEYEWDDQTNAWVVSSNNTMQYTAQGQLQEKVTDPVDPALPTTRETYTYTAMGQVSSFTEQTREGENWVNTDRIRYVYNALGAMEEMIQESWQGGAWVQKAGSRRSFVFSGATISEVVLQNFVEGTGYVNDAKAVLSYGDNGQVTTWTVQYWTGTAWANTALSNRYTDIVWQDWPGFLQAVTQTIDVDLESSFSQVRSYTQQAWNPTPGEWVTQTRTANTFTPTSITSATDTLSEGTWDKYYRSIIANDDRGNLTSLKFDIYDDESEEYVTLLEFQSTYTYNGLNLTEVVTQVLFIPFIPELTNDSRSVFSDFQTFNVTTGVPDSWLSARTKIYPNPTTHELQIELEEKSLRGANVALYTLTGQKVYERNGQGMATSTHTIDLSALPKGIYLLRLVTADNKSLTRKVVRQ